MSIRTILFYCVTGLWLIISGLIVAFITYPDIDKSQVSDSEKIIENVNGDLLGGIITDKTKNSIPDGFMFVLWRQDPINPDNWQPIINDKTFKPEKFNSPLTVSDPSYSRITKVISKNTGDNNYIIWIYKYHLSYIVKYLIIPILFLVLIYLFILLIINILPLSKDQEPDQFEINYDENSVDEYKETTIEAEQSVDPKQKQEIKSEQKEDINTDLNTEKQGNNPVDAIQEPKDNRLGNAEKIIKINSMIYEYKDLWIKDFKISDNFKKNFPFKPINDLVRFSVNPQDYIRSALEIATSYFKWESCTFYISQNGSIIDVFSKQILDTAELNIPLKGDIKGRMHIPLYPYNTDEIYGFLSFVWEKQDKFFIADILFFLKFMFSDYAKHIFTDEKIKNELFNKVDLSFKKNSSKTNFVAFISVDKRDTLSKEIKSSWKELLDTKIHENLFKKFTDSTMYHVSPFCYILYGSTNDKAQFGVNLEKWLEDEVIHTYEISKDYGSVTLTFSTGIEFSEKKTEQNVEKLITSAENKSIKASKQGGNQLII